MKNMYKLIVELLRIYRSFSFYFFSRYLYYLIKKINIVILDKSLLVVDKEIHKKIKGVVNVKYHGQKLIYTTDMISLIREVLLKNCYFFDVRQRYSTVIDLGANLGVFSLIASMCSDNVISVECNKKSFKKHFDSVMELNNVQNVLLVNKFASNILNEFNININSIIKDNSLKQISFIKIDIEGSESELFNSNLEWLKITDSIGMEIHPCFNVDTNKICDILKISGFKVNCYDVEMKKIPDFSMVKMGYLIAAK